MKRLILALFCCALLSACDVQLPHLETCFISNDPLKSDPPGDAELLPSQVQALSDWLAATRGEWTFKLVDHPPAGTLLILKHKNGRTTLANLRGNELWVRDRFKTLSPEEHARLLEILGSGNQLPVFKK